MLLDEMLRTPLITHCVCGSAGPFTRYTPPPPALQLECERCSCGVAHQVTTLSREEYESIYLGEYHGGTTIRSGVPYRDRYEHDRRIASIRIDRYLRALGWKSLPATALDVGAANGAFVDVLRDMGVDAIGIEPDPTMAREHVYQGALADAPGETFGLITYHDVLEHVVDPVAEVRSAAARLAPGPSALVLDVPNVFDPQGLHHYKVEHLWYFNLDAAIGLLRRAGLARVVSYQPIPGKIVAIGSFS